MTQPGELAIDYDDVASAQRRLAGVVHRTPVLRSTTGDASTGATLHFKAEHLQRIGAFKFRGGYNAISQFDAAQKAAGVIAFSSGNHAQAIALSARLHGIRAVIVMPEDAPAIKIAATRGYGAEVVLYDRYTQDREALGRELAASEGLTLIPPFDHPHVMAGQGTAALELFDEVGELDTLIVPLGGGGLISGCATVAKTRFPRCRVIGVEPEAGNDAQQSVACGEIVAIDTPRTIADGAQTQALGKLTFPIIQRHVDEIVTVSDTELVESMRFLASRMKQFVEPTGCLGLAAALSGRVEIAGQRVGIVLSGGNVDVDRFAQLVRSDERR
ncbi:threo-3-hydroxy-L-aspartate ammonia-lyase [Salinicola rhizosphaerae]|uniref:Serine/threonine dehydratase n=1 Tax=Salinicola rhizosphaerae TaxID=1443141 RepID=A0ABQ3DV25_9GAMM|nr:threo-3-hydroxy-L-aspartate ammonia-lyase [Salinicola rhizosphaerae]GHB14289.1 serine/threonine dehydratase [Salinicola rhizosphaerae]